MLTINVNIWKYYRINYIFILELDPNDHITTWGFTDLTSSIYFLWIIHLFLYIELNILDLDFHILHSDFSWIIPIFLYLIFIIWLFFPFNFFFRGFIF
jgi:hypothetical protein